MSKKVSMASMPEKEKPKKKAKVTLVQPKEVFDKDELRKISGASYKKLDAISFAKFVQMAISKGKDFGHAAYGPVKKINVDLIYQHSLNMKWFNLGDNFKSLNADIGNRPAQQAIGVIKEGDKYYCIDGNRRLASYKRLGRTTIEARIAQREMTEQETEYHIIMANTSARNYSHAERVEIAVALWPKLKQRIEEQIYVSRHGGKVRQVQGIPSNKEMAEVMQIPEKEVQMIKVRLTKQIQKEKRGKNLIDFGDAPNSVALMRFYTGIGSTIDRNLSGENAATLKVAQKYLAKKAKNLYST